MCIGVCKILFLDDLDIWSLAGHSLSTLADPRLARLCPAL